MKNPDSKPLRISHSYDLNAPSSTPRTIGYNKDHYQSYGVMLSNLAIAESNLVKAGKDSAMPHFIAIVKELERVYGFKFEIVPD